MRKLWTLAIAARPAVIIGLAAFWIVTLPAVVPASALAPIRANLDNGKTMFDDRRLLVLPCRA